METTPYFVVLGSKSRSVDSGLSDTSDTFEFYEKAPTCKSTDSGDSGETAGSNSSGNSEKPLLRDQTKTDVVVISVNAPGHLPNKLVDKEVLTDLLPNKDVGCRDRQHDPPGRYDDKRFCTIVLVIFVSLDILLFVTIFVLAFGLPGAPSTQQMKHCLSCEDVYLSSDDIMDNIYNFDITDGQCCSTNYTYLVQKYVLKRYKSDSAKASPKSNYPRRGAVHLELDLSVTYPKTEGNNHTLKWNKAGSPSSGDLRLSRDGSQIEVHRPGLYFLSPRITFADNETDVGDTLDPMLLQVYLKTGSELRLLLEGRETHCANTDTTCNIPSSTQGVFRFESGDSVYVHVRMPCGLVRKPNLNQFDMYLI